MTDITYGDWRDDLVALNIPINMAESRYASPMCPKHGWLWMRKKKINVWQCIQCNCKIEIDEQKYRAWRKKNCNNLYSAVPPLKGSRCLTYKQSVLEQKQKWKPKEMEICPKCLASFGRCLAENRIEILK